MNLNDTAPTISNTGGIQPDWRIREHAKQGMIVPFEESLKREGVLSYGLSSYGYDMRLAPEFMVFTNVHSKIIDPKCFDNDSFVHLTGDEVIIPPNGFILGRSLEYFKMPQNVLGLVVGKSTIARCGVQTLCTPIEPGWEGHITLEFANTTPLPVKMYANEGCCQLLFFEGTSSCEISYSERSGKYQRQTGITTPFVETKR